MFCRINNVVSAGIPPLILVFQLHESTDNVEELLKPQRAYIKIENGNGECVKDSTTRQLKVTNRSSM